MNEKNFDFLKDQLKYTGFGENMSDPLKEKMQMNLPEFTLSHGASFGKDHVAATLHFRKSSETDMYFFNRYDLALKNENLADPLKQTFYISPKGDNVTLKEGYNLLSGRAVQKELTNKEGQSYRAWIQLDFKQSEANGNFKIKQFHQAYGFDLEKTLAKHPLKELQTEEGKTALIQSLQRGNRQSATLLSEGGERRVFLEAAPQYKSLNFYESNGQRLRPQVQSQKEKEEPALKQEAQKSTKKQKAEGEEGAAPKIKRSKRSKQSL